MSGNNLARSTDPATSKQAAAAIASGLGKIQALVLEVFENRGAMSAREAEKLSEFSDYGFSTIRKRISELHQEGLLVSAGTEKTSGRTPATVYEAKA